jgi:glycosyltransferase involved in cell wall biosynthesis
VIDAVQGHARLGEIIVVDNASMDGTGRVAAEHGARVISMPVPGKGIAMAAGAASTDANTLLFLDADLLNLRRTHIDQLLDPVEDGSAAMSRGLLDHGKRTAARARLGPVLTGQRAISAELFARLLPADVSNWGVEQALNTIAKKYGYPMQDVILGGLDHVNKTQKYSPWEGQKVRARMLLNTQTARFGVIARHRELEQGVSGVENAVQAAARVLEALKMSDDIRHLKWVL